MIVHGQILGGIVKESVPRCTRRSGYDEMGQPQASTLADYLVPGCGDVPKIRLSEFRGSFTHSTRFGVKGVGEGGSVSRHRLPSSTHVNDALRFFGAKVSEVQSRHRAY